MTAPEALAAIDGILATGGDADDVLVLDQVGEVAAGQTFAADVVERAKQVLRARLAIHRQPTIAEPDQLFERARTAELRAWTRG